jgi:excisionase family DNA binding protein
MSVSALPSRYLSPPEIADRFGVDPAKVVGWIRKGELRAVNVGNGPSRPRYRISPADLAAFEAGRAAGPRPKITRVRRR